MWDRTHLARVRLRPTGKTSNFSAGRGDDFGAGQPGFGRRRAAAGAQPQQLRLGRGLLQSLGGRALVGRARGAAELGCGGESRGGEAVREPGRVGAAGACAREAGGRRLGSPGRATHPHAQVKRGGTHRPGVELSFVAARAFHETLREVRL